MPQKATELLLLTGTCLGAVLFISAPLCWPCLAAGIALMFGCWEILERREKRDRS